MNRTADSEPPSRQGVMHYRERKDDPVACHTRPGEVITQRSTTNPAEVTCARCLRSDIYRGYSERG